MSSEYRKPALDSAISRTLEEQANLNWPELPQEDTFTVG